MSIPDIPELMDVSRETSVRLQTFVEMISKWNRSINLIAESSSENIWLRHVADSAQLLRLAPSGWETWVDLGSGGGFPGLIIALLTGSAHAPPRVSLIESDQRKAAFLREAARQTETPVHVIADRAEHANVPAADVVSARAFAPLSRLLEVGGRFLKEDGTFLFPKGENAGKEVDEARMRWVFLADKIPSNTHPKAAILRITGVSRVR